MALEFWLLDELKIEEALALLREAAAVPNLQAVMPAWQFRWSEDVFGASATIGIPYDDKLAPALEGCFQRYLQWSGRQPKVGAALPGMDGVAEQIAHLLCHYQSTAQAAVETYVLLVEAAEPETLTALFERLRFHATHVRVAAARLGAATVHVFHVLDDVKRKSDFQSLVASEALAKHVLLAGWPSAAGTLFLPLGATPGETVVEGVAEVVRAVPEAFGGVAGQVAQSDCLLACYSAGEHLRLLRLDGLSFGEQARFSAPAQAPRRVEVALLQQSDTALHDLEQTLTRAVPQVAYRLALRRLALPERVQAERERLMARKAELEYQLAFIRGLEISRPRLLRFDQRGLRALAAWLREIPHETLQAGSIRYAFHGSKADPAGHHYLWSDPNDTILQNLDPLPLYRDGAAVREFWLDPLWSRDYLERSQSLVFTPKGAALFPTMHAWSHDQMDDYLRTVIGGWYPDVEVPQQAVFVFEEADEAGELCLTILDRARFEPLHTRLRWLNDNLALAESENSEAWIRAMADQVTRGALSKRLQAWAAQAEKDFTKAARHANQVVADRLADLERVFDKELDQLVGKTETTAGLLEEIHGGLDALLSVKKQMDQVNSKAVRQVTQTRNEATRLTRELGMLERKMELAMAQRAKLSDDVVKEVAALRDAHDKLKQNFQRIMRRQDR